jgi:hypothetical protein
MSDDEEEAQFDLFGEPLPPPKRKAAREPRSHTRGSDPVTSYLAGEGIDINDIHRKVIKFLVIWHRQGHARGASDLDVQEQCCKLFGNRAESTYRKRRGELTDHGYVEQDGIKKQKGIWRERWKLTAKGWELSGQAKPEQSVRLPSIPVPAGTSAMLDSQGRLLTSCAVCGASYAPFGHGVGLRNNMLGQWYCATHNPGGPDG